MSDAKLTFDQRRALVQQVARRLERLDDQRLSELEGRTRLGAPAAAAETAEPGLNRRAFLRDVLLYTGAGLALGGGAAYAVDRWPAPAAGAEVSRAAELVAGGVQAQMDDSAAQVRMLQEALALAERALAEMRPQLSAALTENAGLKNDLSAAQSSLLETRQEADGLHGRLAESEARLGRYQQLLGLFDALEAVPLERAVVNGLAAASVGFGNLLGLVPLVNQGLAAARGLFDNLEGQFPAIRAGLDWLNERLDGLENGIAAVEAAVARAMNTLDPVTDRLGQLIDYILGNLPFGIGRSIRAALAAVNDLYRGLPDLISGARGQIVGVVGEQFGNGKAGLSKAVLQPVRESAFAPAEQLAAQAETLHRTFLKEVHDPVAGALNRRAALRKEIEAFRAANQV